MAIIQRSGGGRKVDPDTVRIVDFLDTDLSHYFEVSIDEANNLVDMVAKIGDFRFRDADDAHPCTDSFQLTNDPATGGVLQKTSKILDGNVWEIIATGTISGASVTVDIDYLRLDLDALVLDDGAANALNIVGQRIDFNGITLTGVTLSTIQGLYIDMPSGLGVAGKTIEGAYIKDGEGNIAHIANGSVALSGTGINDEKYYFCEDFDQEVATTTLDAGLHADEWTFGGNVGAAADVTYIAGAGGIIQVSTTAVDDQSTGAYWIVDNVYVDSNPIVEFRFRVDDVGAAQMGCLLGLCETVNILSINNIVGVTDDIIAIGMNSDLGNPENVRLWTNDTGGGEIVADLGVALTVDTWCTVRFDCTDTEKIRVWINNTGGAIDSSHEIAAATVGAGTIQAGIALIPFLFVHCLDIAPLEHHMEVDYIKCWQDRS